MVKRLGIVFLLVLVRGFVTALEGGLSAWLLNAWADVSIVFVIFTLASLHWWLVRYSFDQETIAVKGGLLFSTDKKIPFEKICSVTCERPLFFRIFGVSRVRFDTLSGTRKRADVSLTLPDKAAQEMLGLFSNKDKKILTPSAPHIMTLSAFISDSLAGAGFAAISITRLGAVAGEELEQRLTNAIDNLLHLIPSGLPPIAKTAAAVVLFGWLVEFSSNLIRYCNLTVIRDKSTLTVKGGALTKRSSRMKIEGISFVNIKQGLFTKLLGIYTAFVHSVGVGKKRGDITAIIPPNDLSAIRKNLEELLPEYKPLQFSLRPDKRAFLGFVADPLWILIPLTLITALTVALTEIPTKILLSLATFVSIPAAWWLLVRIVDLFSSGIGIDDNDVILRYSSFLKFNTVLIKRDNVISVKLRQSLFQRIGKRCDVFVYTKGETADRHRIRNVDKEKARKLLRI